jgi:hypothetical protein
MKTPSRGKNIGGVGFIGFDPFDSQHADVFTNGYTPMSNFKYPLSIAQSQCYTVIFLSIHDHLFPLLSDNTIETTRGKDQRMALNSTYLVKVNERGLLTIEMPQMVGK